MEIFDVQLSRRLACWKFDAVTALSFNPLYPVLAIGVEATVYIVVVKLPAYRFGEEKDADEGDSDVGGDASTADSSVFVPSAWDGQKALSVIRQVDDAQAINRPPDAPVKGNTPDCWKSMENLSSFTVDNHSNQASLFDLGGWSVEHQNDVHFISWHPKGLYFVTVSTNAPSPSLQLGIHSLTKKKSIRPFRKNVGGRVQCARFHPRNNWLVVGFYKAVR